MSCSVVFTKAAEAEFEKLPEDLQGRLLSIGSRLSTEGPSVVGMPHVRPVGGKLWEMRLSGKRGIARALYFAASGRRLIVVRIFVKKTEKTPPQEIELARKRMEAIND